MVVELSEETIQLSKDKLHLYKWSEIDLPPNSIFILIHGLMMNGKSFDSLANLLVKQGSLVVAPDIRGFGRWYFENDNDVRSVDYKRTIEDLVDLLTHLKSKFKNCPIVCLGESLGAHLARKVVIRAPQLVNALILSSPCIRPRMMSPSLIPHALSELVLTGINPSREVDLKPFARSFLKEEPENLSSYIDDPMARKSLEIKEIFKSVRMVSPRESHLVSEEIPILVFRGKKDCVCKESSMKRFVETIKSENLTIKKLDQCGHLIMQSNKPNGEALDALFKWLDSQHAFNGLGGDHSI